MPAFQNGLMARVAQWDLPFIENLTCVSGEADAEHTIWIIPAKSLSAQLPQTYLSSGPAHFCGTCISDMGVVRPCQMIRLSAQATLIVWQADHDACACACLQACRGLLHSTVCGRVRPPQQALIKSPQHVHHGVRMAWPDTSPHRCLHVNINRYWHVTRTAKSGMSLREPKSHSAR